MCDHRKNITVREDHILPAAQQAALRKQLEQLGRAQTNLVKQPEDYEPTGDDDIDTEWRAALQRRFAQIATERRSIRFSRRCGSGTMRWHAATPPAFPR